MTRICWWCVDLVSRLLEPAERDVVRGDFAESGASGGRALRDVLGLAVRRQAALWMDWRPWLALVGVVAPVGMVLSHVSRWWADGSAIYAFLYINNWSPAFLESPGARGDLVELSASFVLSCVTLIGWSWASGFVLGSLSRRTLWISGTLFCLVVVLGTLGTTTTARAFNNSVFSVRFYRVVFPRLHRTFLVLLPAAVAMRRSLSAAPLAFLPTIFSTVAIAMLTVWAWTARSLESSLIFGRNVIPLDAGLDGVTGTADDPRSLWMLPLIVMWPAVYMLAHAGWLHWHGKTARLTAHVP